MADLSPAAALPSFPPAEDPVRPASAQGSPPAFLAGNSEMAVRARAMDWSSTPVGEPAAWPQSLKTAVSICIGSRYPIVVWWGHPAYTMFYNDGYVPILGVKKHPGWFGGSGRECWSEIWPIVGPMLDSVFATGEATWSEDLLLVMDRNIPREENYFTFSYSPIHDDDDKVGGIFCACYETTGRVIGERRLRSLRDLNQLGGRTRTAEEACTASAKALGENPSDVPFSLIYLLEEDGGHARLVAATSLEPGSKAAPHRIALRDQTDAAATWPVGRVLEAAKAELISDLSARFGPLPGGPWPEPTEAALIVPIAAPGHTKPTGFLVAGLSPRRVIDADYRSYFDLIAGHIGTSVANARAYEEERKRAEALADIDRAKTAFFSNVSHEFRTPLTLMMGPLEDTLAQSTGLAAPDRERLELAHRNALRLLKLVNTLLDFSRIEAGRIEASYEPTDVAAFTAELASVFRSATERAGLKLIVDCPPLAEPVFLDREMWEKIVLNLLSNAFKFTLAGEIEVKVEADDREARLIVRDTGTGIPADEIPRLFERFHRVKGARGRSYEGSGIGLSLVQELVRLHGGKVRVESAVDQGSRFIVSLPLGRAHVPADRIAAARTLTSTSLRTDAFVEEVRRWLPNEDHAEPAASIVDAPASAELLLGARQHLPPSGTRAATQRILLADDNADMREYVCRLLLQNGYEVEPVRDGAAALAAARARPPNLVLTDVMMPALDGFGLLREFRADPALVAIPVILLSARAGEEARIDGLQAGADDYLIKPFSARELLARVETHLKIACFRRESEERLRQANTELATRLNELQAAAAEIRDSRRAAMNLMQDAVQARDQVERLNHDLHRRITEREEVHQRLRQRTAQFETLLNQAPLGVYVVDANFKIRDVNPTARPVFGDISDLIGRDYDEVIHILWPKDFADELVRLFRHTLETGESYASPERIEQRADRDATEFYEWRIDRIPVPDGRYGVVCYFRDISAQVRARLALKVARDDALAANRAKDEFLATLSHELRTPLNPVLLVASDSAEDPALSEAVRADFKMIADNISLQAKLIDDLLDFNRIIHGKVTLEQRPLDLHEVIREATTTIHEEIAAKQITLTFSLNAPAHAVSGDPVRLRQVFWNILKNAVKFTPAGGQIEISSPHVARATEIEVRIRDSGIGMSPAELARIFHPFVQGRHTDEKRHETYGGLGLGLAISRMLVENHHGTITAESAGLNLGSTLIVRLPLKSAAAETPRSEPGLGHGLRPLLADPALRVCRVLLVEDHEPTRRTLIRLLEHRGYHVTAARSVADALQQADRATFNVLISDLGLPDGDGCELIIKLRRNHPALPGIVLSGFGMDADLTRSRAAGFEEHLTKPVSIDSLDRALDRLLERTKVSSPAIQ